MASAPLLGLLVVFCAARCFASNTISVGSPVPGGQTVVSKGGGFELGFFHLGGNEPSKNYYVGIWYKKVSQFTPVWVANRAAPVSDPASCKLAIAADGNLVIVGEAGAQVWSTNVTSAGSGATVAVILDSGNLVLRREDEFLWQSMEHPTDSWLPGGRLGRNKVTGEVGMLTSWRSSGDPAPGEFSLGIDPNGSTQYFMYWNRTVPYWSSGEWNGDIFAGLSEMTSHSIFDFEFVSDANVSYFTYSVKDHNLVTRLVMDVSGQVKQLTWVPEANQWMLFWAQPLRPCDVYAACGAFGVCNEKSQPFCSCLAGFRQASPAGCRRNTPLQCARTNANSSANGSSDAFMKLPVTALPKDPRFVQVSGDEHCRSGCLTNCDCTAYSYGGDTCALWYGELYNLQVEQASNGNNDLYLRLAASDVMPSRNRSRAITWASMASVACVLCLSAVMSELVWMFRRRQSKRFLQISEGGLVPFKYGDLQRVTKNFSEKLGGGSFGSVYKGTLPDNSAVAVKRLEGVLYLGDKQFRTEVRTIGIVHHVNLVRLRGFCSRGSDRLLVYDYMPNGSLDKVLFGKAPVLLHWDVRYRVAVGTARGLLYIHGGCRDWIIHCDVKPENILLDAAFVPKVADFGMAKLVGRDFSRVLTTVRGTVGYLAPEWMSGVPITAKADVYSYGMVLLEIVSGRRNAHYSAGSYFPLVAARTVSEGRAVDGLLDERLNGHADLRELDRACRVACWCIQDDEAHRPSMEQVVQMLEGVVRVGVPPVPKSVVSFA